MTELFKFGLHEAASRIRSGRMKCAAYVESLLSRIDALEPKVQAWQWLDRERARALAARSDEKDSHWRAAHPLHGLPVGVKDIFYTAGIPTEMGCSLYAGFVPAEDADLARRLDSAGGILLGKTVTTEAAFMVPAKTRNPWNPAHTPGGSSSGSAAAVAAGFVPAALGTQTNGSVIRPAAFCGVVGYKPSQGMLSARGMLPFSPSLDQPGVFARSVADVNVLRSPPRLAAVRSPAWYLAQPEQRAQFDADIARLRKAGAGIDIIEIPGEFDAALRVHRTIMLYEGARVSRKVRAQHRAGLSDYLNAALDEGEGIADTDYREAMKMRTQLQHALAYSSTAAIPRSSHRPPREKPRRRWRTPAIRASAPSGH
jgi:Asp-tRNA(Asn)/Glu-tRNA(Gln) amidotransferase A subunit family amidase